MTANSQDFTTYAGDAALPIFTVKDGNGAVINISTVTQISWSAQRDLPSAPVLSKTKTGGGITFVTDGTDGKFQVSLTAAETAALTGFYLHEATITDIAGNLSTVATGRMQVGRMPVSTYSGDPQLSDRDAVRMYIGDTDSSNWQLTDPEIDYLLSKFPNAAYAAAQAARNIGARYARQGGSKRVGDLAITYSSFQKQYLDLAAELDALAATQGSIPYSGGTSIADIRAVNSNTDRPRPPFHRDKFDNRSGSYGSDGGWENGGDFSDGS